MNDERIDWAKVPVTFVGDPPAAGLDFLNEELTAWLKPFERAEELKGEIAAVLAKTDAAIGQALDEMRGFEIMEVG